MDNLFRTRKLGRLQFKETCFNLRDKLVLNPNNSLLELTLCWPDWPLTDPSLSSLFEESIKNIQTELNCVLLKKLMTPEGMFALFESNKNPRQLKAEAINFESKYPFRRLIDLDVIGKDGPLSRNAMNLAERSCFICKSSHTRCIEMRSHSYFEVLQAAEKLLSPFKEKTHELEK